MIRLIEQEKEDQAVKIEPIAVDDEETTEENPEEVTEPEVTEEPETLFTPKPETDPEVEENAFKTSVGDSINGLSNQCWEFISNVNGLIATIDFNYNSGDNKEEIKEILNSLVDDATISVGMIEKASELLDAQKSDLINSGREKAEEIIADHPTDDETEIVEPVTPEEANKSAMDRVFTDISDEDNKEEKSEVEPAEYQPAPEEDVEDVELEDVEDEDVDEQKLNEGVNLVKAAKKLKKMFDGDPQYFDEAADIIIYWYEKEDNTEALKDPDLNDILDLLDVGSNPKEREIVAKAIGHDADFIFDDEDDDDDDKVNNITGINVAALANEFMETKYPNGFPDFDGDVIYSRRYWDEFAKWAKETKNADVNADNRK